MIHCVFDAQTADLRHRLLRFSLTHLQCARCGPRSRLSISARLDTESAGGPPLPGPLGAENR